MARRVPPPSQTWRTFLANHIGQIVAADFVVVPTVTYRLLFVLVLIAWTAQQLREAFPFEAAPRDLLHDRDDVFAGIGRTAMGMGIEQVLTAPRSPWHNA